MKLVTKLLTVVIIFALSNALNAQVPDYTWALSYGGIADDYVYGMTMDSQDNIYILGKFKSAPLDFGSGVTISAIGLFDIYLVKFDPTGTPLWAKQAGGQVANEARDAAVNNVGDVALTGGYFGQAIFDDDTLVAVDNFDTFVATYNSAGVLQWIVSGIGEKQIKGTGLTADNDGNFIAVGYFGGTTTDTMNFGGITVTGSGDRDVYIAKIDPNGNVLWVNHGGSPLSGEEPGDVTVDGDNNIYVTGYFKDVATFGPFTLTSEGDVDVFTVKLDPNGNYLWAKGAYGPGNDRGISADFDRVNGNLLVTGYMADTLYVDSQEFISNGGDDIIVISYSAAGDVNFAGTLGGLGDDHGLGIAAKGDGNYYVSGYFEDPFGSLTGYGNDDILVMEMNQTTPVWVQSSGGSDIDQSYGIKLDRAKNVIVGGLMKSGSGTFTPFTLNSNGGRDIVIGKFYDNVVPVELTSFTAKYSSGSVTLNWETITETNNLGFEVLKSYDLKTFNNIGFIEGANTSIEKHSYSFVDNDIDGNVCYYKLKQIDINGEFSYSNTIEVNLISPTQYSIDQNYPNPFNPTTKINFTLPVDGKVRLSVFNLLGQSVAELINDDLTAGQHSAEFDASSLTSGMYIYTISINGSDGTTFSTTRKMVLIK